MDRSDQIAGKCKTVSPERMEEIRKNFPHLPEIKDLTAPRNEFVIKLPNFLEKICAKHMLRDPRDTVMLSTIANILATTVPLAALLWVYPSHLLGIFNIVFNVAMWMERYILCLHYAEHRTLFKAPFTLGNYILPCFVAPFFGIPLGMYPAHHVVMHHIENNGADDLSSTELYQRDNFLHFLHYWAKYFLCTLLLPVYTFRKKRYGLCAFCAFFEGSYAVALAYGILTPEYRIFTAYTFVIPFFVASLALMFGNFSQHIFVHPSIATMPQVLTSYQYNCALSMQLINSPHNQRTFNDGYHVTHHIKSRCHWTDMPAHFLENLERFRDNGAVVFHSCFFNDVGMAVMLGNWQWLYDHYVHLTPEKRSFEEVKADLQARLAPIDRKVARASVMSFGSKSAKAAKKD